MRRASVHFSMPISPLIFAAILLGVGCQGSIDSSQVDGAGSDSGGSSAAGGGPTSMSGASGESGATRGGTGGTSSGQGGSSVGAGGSNGGAGPPPSLDQIATKYFPGQVANNGAKRVFRLTRTQLDLTTKTLLPKHFNVASAQSLPRDPLQTNYEYAENLGFNPANFTPLTNFASQLAAAVKAAPTTVIDCAASNTTCLTDQSKAFVSRAFRGTLPDAQLKRYSDFFVASVNAVGLAAATADLVNVVLTSPNYVFRDEVLTDGTSALLPAQRLQHITYTLADAPPEALGLSSAPSAYLQTPELAQKTIDQVLASAAARDKLMRFFLAWLEVKEPEEFGIASSVFPEFTPGVAAAVVAETQGFLGRQLAKAAPRMQDVTESAESLVPSASAFLYGNGVASGSTPTQLDPSQRLGIFTQPAVLASHSGPTTSRLVKRGVFFVRKVMCVPLGAPPPTLDTSIPQTPGKSERQRVETATVNAPCSGCHSLINPFGFMLENFDAIGRWRTTDEGVPIDPSIDVAFLDEGKVSTQSPVDALRAFTRSLRFQQCFTRQLFRFYTGRDEVAGDDPLLRQMFFDFANNDEQDIVRLLRTLASSSSFSRRSEAP